MFVVHPRLIQSMQLLILKHLLLSPWKFQKDVSSSLSQMAIYFSPMTSHVIPKVSTCQVVNVNYWHYRRNENACWRLYLGKSLQKKASPEKGPFLFKENSLPTSIVQGIFDMMYTWNPNFASVFIGISALLLGD